MKIVLNQLERGLHRTYLHRNIGFSCCIKEIMNQDSEEKIVARGLKSPGPLLLVKKQLPEVRSRFLRVITSDEASKKELVDYFGKRGCDCETDTAGNDIHVIIDLKKFKDVD